MTQPSAKLHQLGGSGPNLLLIHGFGSDRYSWVANTHALFPKATVWAVDLPGHGAAADNVGDGTVDTLTEAVATAISDLDGPLSVVGHSLGGAIALHLADRQPQRFHGMVLLAPAGLGGALDPCFLEGFPEIGTKEQALELLSSLVENQRLIQPAMGDHVLAMLGSQDRRSALRTIATGLKAIPRPPWPPQCPVDVIWGEEDAINPPPTDELPGVHRLPGVGHLPHVEKAAEVNRRIVSLLKNPAYPEAP